jgi:hypothetical protein
MKTSYQNVKNSSFSSFAPSYYLVTTIIDTKKVIVREIILWIDRMLKK